MPPMHDNDLPADPIICRNLGSMTGREPDAATESHRNWLRRAGSGEGGGGHGQDRVRHAAQSVDPLVLGEKRGSEPHPLTDDPRQRDTAAAGTSRGCLLRR